MADKLRFELPDGQTFESVLTEAEIVELHPEAVVTHEVSVDDASGLMTAMTPVGDEEVVPESTPKDAPKESPTGPTGATGATG